MPKSAKDSFDGKCCNCSSAVGDSAHVHPVRVHAEDGKGAPEVWCPRCFVWHRMNLEPDRWDASHTAVVRCQFCPWISVCHGVNNGAAFCGHCGAVGALLIQPSSADMDKLTEIVHQTVEEHNANA